MARAMTVRSPWWSMNMSVAPCIIRRELLLFTALRAVSRSPTAVNDVHLAMGKAKKAKKKAHRFDPLARPPAASSSMDVDGDAPIEAPPKVSAHMARFLERKRLQEEVKSLKQQKGKLKGMSKAEKRDVKARKKKLAHEIHERVARSNDKARAAVAPAEAQAADEEFRFELAAPAVQLDDAWAPR